MRWENQRSFDQFRGDCYKKKKKTLLDTQVYILADSCCCAALAFGPSFWTSTFECLFIQGSSIPWIFSFFIDHQNKIIFANEKIKYLSKAVCIKRSSDLPVTKHTQGILFKHEQAILIHSFCSKNTAVGYALCSFWSVHLTASWQFVSEVHFL